VELIRTQEILERHLLAPHAVVFDVGGGPGIYSCWLLSKGYEVHLVDPVAAHVEAAKKAFDKLGGHPTASARIGNAKQLDFGDATTDSRLLLSGQSLEE
jgi:ubiquinone/menaquinone biosynthesis C-methylase UbiE